MDDDTDVMKAIERVRLELITRRLMVMVLALILVWTGIAMCLTGAPDFMEHWFSPWSRYLIGGFAFLAGLTTSLGGIDGDDHPRGWWTQVVGLTGMVSWCFGMGVAYAALTITEGFHFVEPGHELAPGTSGRSYVVMIYFGVSVLCAIPLVTMLRLKYSRHTP